MHFATSDPEERARQQAMERRRVEMLRMNAASAASRPPIEFAMSLESANSLLKAAQRYCERIPEMIESFKRKGANEWSLTKPEDMPPSKHHGGYNFSIVGS